MRITDATFVPRDDIVAHRHEPLVDDAVERRTYDRVGERLARHRHARARGEKRLVLLLGAVAGDVVLPSGGVGLGVAPVEVGLGEQLPVEEHPRAIEIRLREIGRGARVGDFGDAIDLERRAASRETKPRLELGGIGAGFVRLRAYLGFGDLHQYRARGDAGAALDRRRDDPSGNFRGDVRLLLRGERPRDGDESGDRALDGDRRRGRHRRGVGGGRRSCLGIACSSAAGRQKCQGREQADGTQGGKHQIHTGITDIVPYVEPRSPVSAAGMQKEHRP